MSGPALRERFNGAWRLVSFAFTDDRGNTFHPLGARPEGFLFITPDDYASFNFMAADRATFASDDIFAGAPEELATAAKSTVSFAGPFRIDGATIVVDVEFSLFPNWIGKPQVRAFELVENALTLRTVRPLPIAGALRRGEARLVRA